MESARDDLEKKLQHSNATPVSIPLEFLKAITSNFSSDSVVGEGGFGVVYKGILRSGKVIAVKKLFEMRLKEDTFQNEVRYLMGIKHTNIVQFLGYCAESSWEAIEQPSGSGKFIFGELPKRLLCFEYVSNKSLDKHIADESSGLEWNMRYKIIKGICNGLHFLHEECRMVHLDLKPENILMDSTMIPKIADFGLSRIFSEQQTRIVTHNRAGTCGYMAPEYLIQGVVSNKADIFSLGVILIEIITGGRDYPYFHQDSPHRDATTFQQFTEKVLGSWMNRFTSTPKYKSMEKYTQQIKQCVTIALKCVDPGMDKRPTAKDIIQVFNVVDQMEAHEELSPVMQCTEKLLVQNTTASKDLTPLSVTEDMLINKTTTCKVVDEAKSEGLSPTPMLESSVVTQNYQEGEKAPSEPQLACDTATETETIQPLIQIIDAAAGKIYCIDANQTEPLILTGHKGGHVQIWNYDMQEEIVSFKASMEDVWSVMFIARKRWFVAIFSDCLVQVYNYENKIQKVTHFMAHNRPAKNMYSLAVHPTQPYVLSGCNTQITLWDWDQGWYCKQFQGHSGDVCYVTFNPEDTNCFASASDDCTIKIWSIDSPKSKHTLSGHSATVESLGFFTCDGQRYLISGSSDKTAKIWDMQKKECVHTLKYTSAVLSVLSHSSLPVLVTGMDNGVVHVWSSTNFRLKRTLNIGNRGWVTGFACLMGPGWVAVGHDEGVWIIQICDEEQGGRVGSNDNSVSSTESWKLKAN